MYSLYWIHYPEHTNPYCQGYIGLSYQPEERFREHKQGKLKKYIKKGAFMEILKSGLTFDEVKILEEEYRPKDFIGWNITSGGQVPPSRKNANLSNTKNSLTGNQRTEAQKQASKKHSIHMKGKIPWNKGIKGAGKECGTKSCTYRGVFFNSLTEAANYFGVSVSAVSKSFKKANK
jgi:predicted GIY-YIG superfamily endonuclease